MVQRGVCCFCIIMIAVTQPLHSHSRCNDTTNVMHSHTCENMTTKHAMNRACHPKTLRELAKPSPPSTCTIHASNTIKKVKLTNDDEKKEKSKRGGGGGGGRGVYNRKGEEGGHLATRGASQRAPCVIRVYNRKGEEGGHLATRGASQRAPCVIRVYNRKGEEGGSPGHAGG